MVVNQFKAGATLNYVSIILQIIIAGVREEFERRDAEIRLPYEHQLAALCNEINVFKNKNNQNSSSSSASSSDIPSMETVNLSLSILTSP